MPTENQSNLLPCPFCGGADIRPDTNLAGDFLQCWTCGARGPLSTSECSSWQTRAAQPAPAECDAAFAEQYKADPADPSNAGDLRIWRDAWQRTQSVGVLEGWREGVEAVVELIEKKANDYAAEFGHDDMGGLSFGSGFAGDVKRDHHSTLIEMAEEVRTMLTAAPQPAARQGYMAGAPLLTNAAQDVLAERNRQITSEGWTPEHDDHHTCGELADAAACYALWGGGCVPHHWLNFWPFDGKPKLAPSRRMLVKAGALILAEIERLDRVALAGKEGQA